MPHRTRRLTSRCVVLLAAATLTLGPPSAAHASVVGALGILDDTANGGINPNTGAPWAPGDTYRFVFITSSDHTAVSPLIESYNQQVQLIADLSPLGIGMSEGVSWTVVGSTDQVDARDNTQANPSRQFARPPRRRRART